jgi:hypothetical protein
MINGSGPGSHLDVLAGAIWRTMKKAKSWIPIVALIYPFETSN